MAQSLRGEVQRPGDDSHDGWQKLSCGHCGQQVVAAVIGVRPDRETTWFLLCPNCAKGTVVVGNIPYPGAAFGPKLEGLPIDIDRAYREAQGCISVQAFAACELMCRKLLMHVAVDKGAKEGENFTDYISHLENQGYITPPIKPWADRIRQHANKATHRLDAVPEDRAKDTLMFTAELLRLIYEMEFLNNKYTANQTP